jgi:hypothetical protein
MTVTPPELSAWDSIPAPRAGSSAVESCEWPEAWAPEGSGPESISSREGE